MAKTVISAALYFDFDQRLSAPFLSFQRACDLFAEHRLWPVLFDAEGAGFRGDDCYLLADHGTVHVLGRLLEARGRELSDAMRRGQVAAFGLDSPSVGAIDREDWRASFYLWPDTLCYLGIEEGLISDPSALLRRAYQIARAVPGIRYGIAYRSQIARHASSYAIGRAPGSVSGVRSMIWHRREWESRRQTAEELWADEINGRRRYLSGLFRAAFSASVLSESHVVAAGLRSRRIGRLSELDDSLWLWELLDSEISVAQNVLESLGVLVWQQQ